jgi:hypothetical protein
MVSGVTGLSPLGGIAGGILGAVLIPILPLTQWRARKRNPNFSATTADTFSDRGVALRREAREL